MCRTATNEIQASIRELYRAAVSASPQAASTAPAIVAVDDHRYLIAAGEWPDGTVRAAALELIALTCRPHTLMLCSQEYPRVAGNRPTVAIVREQVSPSSLVFLTVDSDGRAQLTRQEMVVSEGEVVFSDEETLEGDDAAPAVLTQMRAAQATARSYRQLRGAADGDDWSTARDSLASTFGFSCLLIDR